MFLNDGRLEGPFTFQFYTKWYDGIPVVIISASVNKVARDTVVYSYEYECSGQNLSGVVFSCIPFRWTKNFFWTFCFKFNIHLHKTNMVDIVFEDKQNKRSSSTIVKELAIYSFNMYVQNFFPQLFQRKYIAYQRIFFFLPFFLYSTPQSHSFSLL